MKTAKEQKATSILYMTLFLIALGISLYQYISYRPTIDKLEHEVYALELEQAHLYVNCNHVIKNITGDSGLILEDFIK